MSQLVFEFRQQPDNLRFSDQDDWYDAFVGYFPTKNISVVAAYANLGTIANFDKQDGFYVSLELAY